VSAPVKVWVLLKETAGETTAHAVYTNHLDLLARVERIGEANASKYPLERLGADRWRIGPDEDEGFFGNKPVYLQAVYVSLDSGVTP
jgi:hypothetical protein